MLSSISHCEIGTSEPSITSIYIYSVLSEVGELSVAQDDISTVCCNTFATPLQLFGGVCLSLTTNTVEIVELRCFKLRNPFLAY